MRFVRRLLTLALFVAVLVGGWQFAAHNTAPVGIDYVFGRMPPQPTWLVLLAAFAGGFLVAGLLAVFGVSRAKLVARRYRKLAGRLESEVHQLRNLPLATHEEVPPRSSAGRAPDLREVAGSAGRSG